MSIKLFVGGLSPSTDEAALRAVFAPHAAVSEVEVEADPDTNGSRRFGYVTLRDADTAEAVIAALNGVVLDGARIRVREAMHRPLDGGRGR